MILRSLILSSFLAGKHAVRLEKYKKKKNTGSKKKLDLLFAAC